jgi:hypothetical protein
VGACHACAAWRLHTEAVRCVCCVCCAACAAESPGAAKEVRHDRIEEIGEPVPEEEAGFIQGMWVRAAQSAVGRGHCRPRPAERC